MPDSFFTSSKSRKRKRPQISRNAATTKKPKLKSRLDEELSGQGHSSSDDDEWGGIQNMDLRAEEPDPGASGDEDQDETPAEKRLRLAQLYLDSIKESVADGEFDAAEIDKEIISSRLKQDILSHSGKVYLFVADSFSSLFSSSTSTTFTSTPTPTFTLPTLRTRGHRFSVTSAVTSPSSKYLFTSGKEGTIIKWDLATGKKLATLHKSRFPSNLTSFSTHAPTHASTSSPLSGSAKNIAKKNKGRGKTHDSLVSSTTTTATTTTVAAAADAQGLGHTDEVLTLALSSDGKYLASGGRDRRLIVWDVDTLTLLKSFQGPMNHKDVISALSFRHSTHQLFTASFDRTIKLYDLSPSIMGYTETLFGHQDSILSLSSLSGENCVSVGGRDKTARYWKIVEESQLVFRGGGTVGGKGNKAREILEGGLAVDEDAEEERGKEVGYVEGSLECIAMIDESTFVTGGNSGSISLWSTQKKKPVFTHPLAHGLNQVQSSTEGLIQTPRWITALSAFPYSDLFASGSWDGHIRLWKLDPKLKLFSLLGGIPIPGVINSLQLISPPKSFFTSLPPPPLPPSTTSNGAIPPSSSSLSPNFSRLQQSSTISTNIAIPNISTATASLPAHPTSPSTSTSISTATNDGTSNPIKSASKSKSDQPNSEIRTSWLHARAHTASSSSSSPSPAVLVIAGTGQEHRFGRWLTVKEGGAVNGAYVVALLPSTTLDNSVTTATAVNGSDIGNAAGAPRTL